MSEDNLFERAYAALMECDAQRKVDLAQACYGQMCAAQLGVAPLAAVATVPDPGRPARPTLVAPRELPGRSLASDAGRAALIHSLCHIEFNAINLALDAVYRFQDMPRAYYRDWLKVAAEEARHFSLLRAHLHTLGCEYGDFAAHNGLWEAALQTAHDVLVRMALVPRVLEARGLDVTPGIMAKLQGVGDEAAVEILRIIERDEIGHVRIGTHWFHFLCRQRRLAPEPTFKTLLQGYMQGRIKGPLAAQSRRRAGFSESELRFLESAI